MYLPSNLLISSSFLNKTWYRITCTLIRKRNNGKCLAQISGRGSYSQLQELDQLCAEIEEHGRVVPFNGLKIYDCDIAEYHGGNYLDPDAVAIYRRIRRLRKLKHLEIESTPLIGSLCPLQEEILALENAAIFKV